MLLKRVTLQLVERLPEGEGWKRMRELETQQTRLVPIHITPRTLQTYTMYIHTYIRMYCDITTYICIKAANYMQLLNCLSAVGSSCRLTQSNVCSFPDRQWVWVHQIRKKGFDHCLLIR